MNKNSISNLFLFIKYSKMREQIINLLTEIKKKKQGIILDNVQKGKSQEFILGVSGISMVIYTGCLT